MSLIVVVDDSSTNRAIFSRLVTSIASDAEIVCFSDPRPVLEWLPGRQADLIITDYKMPGMEGAEFVRLLRELMPANDVPIIVITAYNDREFRLRALEAGATDFLNSPVDHQEFVTRGRNVLRLGQHQRTVRRWAVQLQRDLIRSEESLETAIQDSTHRLMQVIDTIPALISASDQTGRRVFENSHSARLLPSASVHDPAGLTDSDRRILSGEAATLRYEEDVVGADQIRHTFLTSKYPLLGSDGHVRHVLTTSFDITERKLAEQAIEHLAHHDTLTGLLNRFMLVKQLDLKLAAAAGQDGIKAGGRFALHLVDLDRFKSINDGFGHDQGDLLLQEIAARFTRIVGPDGILARLGGDEFAIVQTLADGPDEASALAGRIIDAVAQPFAIESYRASIGASVGITLAPTDGTTPEQLLKTADLAMYTAKHEGRGGFRFFSPDMQVTARDTVRLEIELREGIGRGELTLHYQPQVDTATGEMVGVESLVRWVRREYGLMPPGHFLDRAEEAGLMGAIDSWALREACRQAAEWVAEGRPLVVGVNISPATLKAHSILALVTSVLTETGLDPRLLELELTEGALMQSQHDLAVELQALRQTGVRIAIDDFGTGYSSLAYLQRLPIDRLKIDKSFVQGGGSQTDGSSIVQAIVGIGRSLHMEVLAEGIESLAQLEQARANGCRLAQGYLFGKPVPPTQLQWTGRPAWITQPAPTAPP